MRLLLGPGAPLEISEGEVAESALASLYPWPDQGPWVRAMMVQTLDGSPIGPDGRSRSISTPVDLEVLLQARRGADAVLIGAQTMRVERYKPLARARLAIVSGSLDLPWQEPVWSGSAQRPLVITAGGVDAAALATAREHAEVEVLEAVTATAIIDALARHGLRRITCEGGPRLLAELVRAGLVDELDVTIAPLMVGGGQVSTGAPEDPARYHLVQVLEDDGYLFTRLVR